MRYFRFSLLVLAMVSFVIPAFAQVGDHAGEEPDARTIIARMDERMRGDASFVEMRMTIERPRYTREITLKSWSLGADYSLILITAPARDEGTVYLKREREIWNYIPSVNRTIKLPPSMMSQSWMGSDFTHDELVRESSVVDDYTHRIVRTETYQDRQVWVVELTPKPQSPVVWGKVLVWVTHEGYMQLRVENFDQQGRQVNTMLLSEIKTMGGRELPTRFELVPHDNPDQRTVMQYIQADFAIQLDPSFFTRQRMERIR